MNNNLFGIICKLLCELNLNAGMLSLSEDSQVILESQNIILVRRGNIGDYFLLAELKISELHSVNRDLQTSLMLQLNHILFDTDGRDLQPLNGVKTLKADNNFEKNTTLVLFIQKKDGIDSLLSKITEIEEDEYFFKKQVVLLPTKFLEDLGNEVSNSTNFEINKYLQDYMSNTDNFKQFLSNPNNDANYAGCAQLFEKLPFLHLNVKSSQSNALQDEIDDEIAKSSKLYSITSHASEDYDSNLVIFNKNLKNINETALKYASKAEESDAILDTETLLIDLQGNRLNE